MPQHQQTSIEDPRAAIRAVVGQVLAARGNPEAFLGFLHDDAVFHMTGSVPDFPFAGVYAGKPAIREMLARVDVEVAQTDTYVLQLLIDEDRLAMLRLVSMRHRGTSARIELVVSHFVRFKDFKAVEIHEYFDTQRYASMTDGT